MNLVVLRQIEDFRRNKEMLLDAFRKRNIEGIQELCVLAGIPIYVGFILVNEEIKDPNIAVLSDNLLRFYGY